jgi:hypothetical protein
MADFDFSKTTTTNLSAIRDYSIPSKPLDYAVSETENYVYFDKAADYFGYYKTLPQLKQAVDALATWTVGRGWTTLSSSDKVALEYISGWGEDSIDSILENMLVVKKIIGDSFAEIIKDGDQLINLKPISPERIRIVVGSTGRIVRYDYKNPDGWKPLKKEQVFHLCNNRVGDETHGQSIIESCSWALKAREEAMDIYRKILKRSLAMGVLYVDTDDSAKITQLMAKYKDAVEKGEVLVLPMKLAELKDTKISVQDFIGWIQYLENFIYQALGIPKIILGGSQEFTEASSKVGYLTFEQVYMAEQRKLEQDFWNQLQIKIKFERPVSLKDDMVASEAANTGQVGIQPNETTVGTGRTE